MDCKTMFLSFFQSTRDIAYSYELDNKGFPLRFIDVSDKALLYFGYERAEFLSLEPSKVLFFLKNQSYTKKENEKSINLIHKTKSGKTLSQTEIVLIIDIKEIKFGLSFVEEDKSKEFHSLFYHNPSPVLSLDIFGKVLDCNEKSEVFLKEKKEQLIGKTLNNFFKEKEKEIICQSFQKAVNGEPFIFQTIMYNKNKEKINVKASLMPIKKGAEVKGVYVVLSDITQRIEDENNIRKLAYFDSLTSLPNRELFKEALKKEIKNAKEKNEEVAVLFFDMDNFKNINDTLGHAAGDDALKTIASRLQKAIREGDIVSRISGDEFTMILSKIKDKKDILKVITRIEKAFIAPVFIEKKNIIVTPSIGISVYPKDGDNPDELLKNADQAMYKVKEKGKNGYGFFQKDKKENMQSKTI